MNSSVILDELKSMNDDVLDHSKKRWAHMDYAYAMWNLLTTNS